MDLEDTTHFDGILVFFKTLFYLEQFNNQPSQVEVYTCTETIQSEGCYRAAKLDIKVSAYNLRCKIKAVKNVGKNCLIEQKSFWGKDP